MANPRKFSEKIALHHHRQAEETARFEQIMREVSDATSRVQPDRGSGKNTLRINNQTLGSFRGGSLPNVSAGTPTVKTTSHVTDSSKPEDGPHSNTVQHRESRARNGGPIRRPQDRRHDTSPYSTGPLLSLPPDTSWRRTNSDSALHQSAMQGMGTERNDNSNSRWMLTSMNGPETHEGRPRSSCEVPRVPGINIYPSVPEPGTIQIPIGNNTGSLPDLTNVHFPSPIHTPLDQDQDHGSSPYSSSPVNNSPSTLSPTQILSLGMRQPQRFQFSNAISHHQNHLSVPVTSRYLHHNKGVALENNIGGLVDQTDFAHLSMGGMYQQQQCPPSPSPSPTLHQPTGYRSPRPSPQSSPGRHSAPCSPGAPSPLSNDYHILNQHQAAQLQQHFEQFSMDWAQLVASLVESGCTWTAQVQMDSPISNVSYVDQSNNMNMNHTQSQTMQDLSGVGSTELSADAGYYSTSPSQLVYPTAPPSLHTTPNTPTSIPDIILTDFSSAGEDMSRSELSLTKQLEAELLSDESLREGLGPIDLDSLQMLSDPGMNLISESVEDHFRLDRL